MRYLTLILTILLISLASCQKDELEEKESHRIRFVVAANQDCCKYRINDEVDHWMFMGGQPATLDIDRGMVDGETAKIEIEICNINSNSYFQVEILEDGDVVESREVNGGSLSLTHTVGE